MHIPQPPIGRGDKHKLARWEFFLNTLYRSVGTFESLQEDIEVLDAQFEGLFEIPPQDSFIVHGGDPDPPPPEGEEAPETPDRPGKTPQPYDNNTLGRMAPGPWLNAMKAGNTTDLPIKRKTIKVPENYTAEVSPAVEGGMLKVTATKVNGLPLATPGDLFKFGSPDPDPAEFDEPLTRPQRVYEVVWTTGNNGHIWYCNPGILPFSTPTSADDDTPLYGPPRPCTSIRIRMRGQPQLIENQDRYNYGGHEFPWKEAFA